MKMTYKALVAINLGSHGVGPGDTVSLVLRNASGEESMFCLAQRLQNMFAMCYSFYPAEIAVHPDHAALIKKQEKTLDVTIGSEQIGKLIGELLELSGLPVRIPLVADETLDLFTAVARFHFAEDDMIDFLAEVVRYSRG